MSYRPIYTGPALPVRWVWIVLALAFAVSGRLWGFW